MYRNIKAIVCDIDGVLTDGRALLVDEENEAKQIFFRDMDAIFKARREGFKIAFLTAESTPAVDRIVDRFEVEHVVRGMKDKEAGLKKLAGDLGIDLVSICYIGDGDRDAGALKIAGLGLAPSDASPDAKAAADRILSQPGGGGAVAEAVSLVIKMRDMIENRKPLIKGIASIVEDSINAHRSLKEEHFEVLADVAQALVNTIRSGHKLLLFGNGGSAADAQHIAGELVGRFLKESPPWAAIALTTDTSVLTCVGNDWDFSEIFSRQVQALAKPGDLVAGISTSGNSPNVLKGLDAARNIGAVTIGFMGNKPSKIYDLCDICFRAPSESTPRIQELHILAWHAVCEMVEAIILDQGE